MENTMANDEKMEDVLIERFTRENLIDLVKYGSYDEDTEVNLTQELWTELKDMLSDSIMETITDWMNVNQDELTS
jgi:hypothetical protein